MQVPALTSGSASTVSMWGENTVGSSSPSSCNAGQIEQALCKLVMGDQGGQAESSESCTSMLCTACIAAAKLPRACFHPCMLLLPPPAHPHLAQLVDSQAAVAAGHHCVRYGSVQQARVAGRLSDELQGGVARTGQPGGTLLKCGTCVRQRGVQQARVKGCLSNELRWDGEV